MPPELTKPTLLWLRHSSHRAIDSDWVLGASDRERTALGGLGAIAGFLLDRGRMTVGQAAACGTLPPSVQRWLDQAPTLPADVAASVELGFSQDPDSYLAALYAQLVHRRNRRRLGTFFTPTAEVELMLSMWDSYAPPPRSVIDIGAGVGVFTAAAAARWQSAKIHAVDVNPVTLGLLAARLHGPHQVFLNTQLVHDDFTTWVDEGGEGLPSPRLFLGNPPYTRAQLLPLEERRRLQTQTAGLCGSRASLSAFITAISLLHLRSEDGLCLLLPAQWLESTYATELRRNLWERARRRVELRLVESELFEDAVVDAVALLVGPESRVPGMFVSLWNEQPQVAPTKVAFPNAPQNWRSLFNQRAGLAGERAADRGSGDPPKSQSEGRRLCEFATIRRGVATGANSFFVLNEQVRGQWELARWAHRRVVTRLRGPSNGGSKIGAESVSVPRWLLEAPREEVLKFAALAAYIAHGEEQALQHRVLCTRRDPWYDLRREVHVPDVVISPMTREAFRVVDNTFDAAITNNLYGLTWAVDVDGETRSRVLNWLRSEAGQERLRGVARNQANGLLKIEPKALKELKIPHGY